MASTIVSRLEGLLLTAEELRALTNWNERVIEDYLELTRNIILLADCVDIITPGDQVSVSDDDTTSGYLEDKLVTANNRISLTTLNGGGNEQRQIELVESNIVHQNLSGAGSNTHAQIDAHIADSSIHFTEGSIDHTAIQNIGTNTHAQIDSHIADGSIHFTEGSINHTAIQNIGTNSHADIDNHIADGSIHFTEGSISHLNIQDIGSNSHAQIDSHIADGSIHFTEGSIDHTAIQNVGVNTHAQIDGHIADISNPHSVTIDQVTPTTTKGDLLVENGANVVRVPVGTDGDILLADSSEASGVRWADFLAPTEIYNTIWAEENGVLANGSNEWSYGNGATGAIGIVATYSGTIKKCFIECDSAGTSVSINVMINFVSAGTATFNSSSEIFEFNTAIAFSEGDIIGFQTNTVVGTWRDARVGVSLIQEVIGLKGDTGSGSNVTLRDSGAPIGIFDTINFNDLLSVTDDGGGTASIDVEESNIDHTAIQNVGTNTHAQIDSHIGSNSNPHSVTIDQVTPTNTKGDLIVEDGSNAVRKAVGSDGEVLVADSGEATGLNWSTRSKVVQSDYIVGTTLNPETDEDDPDLAVVIAEMTKTFSASAADNKIKVKFKGVFGGAEDKKGKVKKDGARCAVFLDGTRQEETRASVLADEEEEEGTLVTFWEGEMGDTSSHTIDIRMWCYDGDGITALEDYRLMTFEEIDE